MSRVKTVVLLILCIGLIACTRLSPEDQQISGLGWPKDGLYGMAVDGYLGFMQDEAVVLQTPVIQVTNQSGPRSMVIERVSFITESGQALRGEPCDLLPGSKEVSYQMFTMSCQLQTLPPATYRLSSMEVVEASGTKWSVPIGNITLEIVDSPLFREIFVSSWFLHHVPSDEYRALLVNKGQGNWTVSEILGPKTIGRLGSITRYQQSAQSTFPGNPNDFRDGSVELKPNASVLFRALFATGNGTMIVLRPLARINNTVTSDMRLIPLQTTNYIPNFSPRDIQAFTKNPQHLRTMDEALVRPK